MSQPENSQQVYEILLEQVADETKKEDIYYLSGMAKNDRAEYEEAITSYAKSFEIYKKVLPSNHPNLAMFATTTSIMCMPTCVNIRKHFRITKKLLELNKNHFLRIILLRLSSTITPVWYIQIWEIMRKHVHFLNVLWILDSTRCRQITVIFNGIETTSTEQKKKL